MPEEVQAPEESQLVGEIIHYFGHIGVAVIKLSGVLKDGETIRIVGGDVDFTQTVQSMEVDHQKVEEAKAGESVGLKVEERIREGYKVYKT